MPLQPGPGAAGLPSAPHRPARHLRRPPLGRGQRCQLPAVQRATNAEDPGHAEEGEGHFPVNPAPGHISQHRPRHLRQVNTPCPSPDGRSMPKPRPSDACVVLAAEPCGLENFSCCYMFTIWQKPLNLSH